MDLSIVIPVHNEAENIGVLIKEIVDSMINIKYEIIVVDDDSSDNTLDVLSEMKIKIDNLRIIKHSANYGQSFAIKSGIEHAKSDWIATLDGDGQNDPSDILRLFNILLTMKKNKNIMIAGHRVVRKDSFLKKFSSKYANKVRDFLLKDSIPDTGCGLKIFNKYCFDKLPFFNHIHRYLPALHIANCGDVVSVEVNHRERERGVSKYGFNNRFWVGIIDLLGVLWLQKKSKKIEYKEL